MSDTIYQDIILDHYRHPRRFGSLKNPNHKVDVSNPLCGDKMHLEIIEENGIVRDIAYQGQGCAISQASASLLLDSVVGKSKAEIKSLDKSYLLNMLGIQLSPNRLKCALLCLEALKKALV